MRIVWSMLACGLVLAACEPEPPRPNEEPPAAAGLEAEERQRCSNEAAGFAVTYPAGWHTNDGSAMPVCSLFDPEPIEVPVDSEIPPDIAVSIGVDEVAFATVAASEFALQVLEREDVTVAGRLAVRRLVEHTGEALWERGMRSYQYIVDWGENRTLIAESHDAGEPAFGTKRAELDRAAASLARR